MPTEIIVSLISSIVGGLLVSIVNFILARNKNRAETEKFIAETDKIRAETSKIRIEMEKLNISISSSANEKIIYDGTKGIEGYDITESLGCTIKDGALIFGKLQGGFSLCKYINDGKVKEFLPKNILLEGTRKIRVSCEAKITEGSCDLVFLFKPPTNAGVLEMRYITLEQTDWRKTDLYFRVPSNEDCALKIYLEPKSANGSLQLRNLVLAERSEA